MWRDMTTKSQDSAAIATIAASIREAAADSRRWSDALGDIAHYLNAAFAVLIFEDRVSALLELKYSTRSEKEWVAEYIRHHRTLDSLRARALDEIGVGRAFSSGDFLSMEKFRRSGAFQRWMEPHGLVDLLGAVIHRSQAGSCIFVAFRDAAAGVVDETAMARLQAALPHLTRAVEGASPGPSIASSAAMMALFDQLAAPVLIVDAQMGLSYLNKSAEEMLRMGAALGRSKGALVVNDARAREALEGALAHRDGDGLAIMLKNGEERCCVMHVQRLPEGGAALFVRSLTPAAFNGGGVVSELYGLTARERSVLLAIAEVGGVPATARALGLSEGTVKGYLKSIFQKTGATRQADLVKLVLALESPFRAPPPAKIPA